MADQSKWSRLDETSGSVWGQAQAGAYDAASAVVIPATQNDFTFSLALISAPDGPLDITVHAQDAAGNEASQIAFSVTKETIDPVISDCPNDIYVVAPMGETAVEVEWTEPTAADGQSGLVSFDATHAPGDSFEIGLTTVTYTAVDLAGNTSTCSFDITVAAIGTTGEDGGGLAASILTIPGVLDPEVAPMVGDCALVASCTIGEAITGSLMLRDANGLPLRGVSIILYFYDVELIDGIAHQTLLTHWSISYDTETGDWSFTVDTSALEPGYYYIYLSFPGGSSVTLPIEVL